jgi:hypothetical protein
VDAEVVADRLGTLSDAVAEAGVRDMAEGAEMLAVSDDVEVLTAMVGLMSADDAEHGLELGRISGELITAARVLDRMQMPLLTIFLERRGARLQDMAVEQVLKAAGTRALAQHMAATGQEIEAMGEDEVAVGSLRLSAADAMETRSEQLARAGVDLAVQGAAEVAAAAVADQVARAVTAEAVADIAEGSAALGAASAMEDVAEVLAEKAK